MSVMQTQYSPGLVALSLVVAVSASYVALDLLGSLSQAVGRTRAGWLAGGALAMGFGIWSMHFIGMLAFEMPGMPMSYDVPLMMLSILVAVGASGFALSVMSRPHVARRALFVSALAMASAIAGMHYIGMYSMRMPAEIVWDYRLVALSLVIALAASLSAFLVALRLPTAKDAGRLQSVASVLMGLAIAGMHYVGMEAASFRPTEHLVAHTSAVIPSSQLTVIVTTSTLLILGIALVGSITDRAFARRNVSERESQRRTRDAETASALKTRFLANMSHEIRTPLGAILGFAELLLEDEATEVERRTYVQTILRSARSLSQLLDDILDLSKIEMDRLELEHRPLELRTFVGELITLLKIKADEKGLGLRFVDAGRAPRSVLTDSVRLRQVLTNIVGNAIKFTARGEVTLILDRETNARGDYVIFEVRDTGIGISDQQLEHLFQPFSQADSSMTRRFGGTGLGLDISRRLARALGGDVDLVFTQATVGSTFKIHVICDPVADETSGKPAPVRPPSEWPSLAGHRVLLVEDNEDNQTLITHVLTRQGAQVTIAGDGAAGVTAALGRPYDVILMDIQMPVMNGLEAMRAIRGAGATVPIIALTAHALSEERDACLAHGANAYLRKPIRFDDLVSTIHNLVHHV